MAPRSSPDLISTRDRRGARRGEGLAEPAAGCGIADRLPGRAVLKIRDQGRGAEQVRLPGAGHEYPRARRKCWASGSRATRARSSGCKIMTELKNRGVADMLLVCCDGLKGFPDAIEAVFPRTTVQTCIVHMIRNSLRFVAWADRKPVANALKPIYAADTEAAAEAALTAFERGLGQRYPMIGEVLAGQLAAGDPVLRLPARHPESDLHDERDRIAELPAPEDHQDAGAFSVGRRRLQTSVPGAIESPGEMDHADPKLEERTQPICSTFRRSAAHLRPEGPVTQSSGQGLLVAREAA